MRLNRLAGRIRQWTEGEGVEVGRLVSPVGTRAMRADLDSETAA
jgi:hypothetical protein